MRNISLVLNPDDIKTSSIDFASYIANLTCSSVRGMFLENTSKKELAERRVSHNGEAFKPLTSGDTITQRSIHNKGILKLIREKKLFNPATLTGQNDKL